MDELIKLTFLGDTMCKNKLFDKYIKTNEYDFSPIFRETKLFFENSDFVAANLETPISIDNTNLTAERFCFNSPYEFAKAAYESGIDFFATANNHSLDRGIEGIASTCDSLNKLGVKHTGVFKTKKDRKPVTIDVEGIKLGMLSYTYGTNAFSNHNYLKKRDYWRVNLFQRQELTYKISKFILDHRYDKKLIWFYFFLVLRKLGYNNFDFPVYERREASYFCKKKMLRDIKAVKKEKPDLVVMYMHIGGQYNESANKYTRSMSNYLVNHGVDIVVGSHEHVVHSGDFSKMDKNKLITYSLGNFDGVAGVYDDPFDKMAEYSVAWNVYVSKNYSVKLEKTTFSVLKTVKDDLIEGGIKVVPAHKLYFEESDCEKKEQLKKDILKIATIFSGKENYYKEVFEEFII